VSLIRVGDEKPLEILSISKIQQIDKIFARQLFISAEAEGGGAEIL